MYKYIFLRDYDNIINTLLELNMIQKAQFFGAPTKDLVSIVCPKVQLTDHRPEY